MAEQHSIKRRGERDAFDARCSGPITAVIMLSEVDIHFSQELTHRNFALVLIVNTKMDALVNLLLVKLLVILGKLILLWLHLGVPCIIMRRILLSLAISARTVPSSKTVHFS